MKLINRPTCYLHKTVSFLWIKDEGNFGEFFTLANSIIEIVRIRRVKGIYYLSRDSETGEYSKPLTPCKYNFYKALLIYRNSTLPKTRPAQELIDEFLKGYPVSKKIDFGLVSGNSAVSVPETDKRPNLTAKTREFTSLTLAQIAAEFGIDPGKARQIARSKLTKPPGGWVWNNNEDIDKVKAILKKHL